jgi:hypothetical protein
MPLSQPGSRALWVHPQEIDPDPADPQTCLGRPCKRSPDGTLMGFAAQESPGCCASRPPSTDNRQPPPAL